MLNYWWVTRPKRKLDSIPEILHCFADIALGSEWRGNRQAHLAFENELEKRGLKRAGERKDQRGSGGRTYYAWLASLGLVFTHEATGRSELTLAGEEIVNGNDPKKVLCSQIMKYQFPSPFSLSPSSPKTRVDGRFNIRPFRFLLKLLRDECIDCRLTKEEIARVVVVEACDETQEIYEKVIDGLLRYRKDGISSLSIDFFQRYAPSSGQVNIVHPYSHLDDLANTLINWLQYTSFISQDINGIYVSTDCVAEVDSLLRDGTELIECPQEQETFQRQYGLISGVLEDVRVFE